MLCASSPLALGIDIGGSGVKGALVNLTDGTYASQQRRIPTPQPAKPLEVAQVCRELIDFFDIAPSTPVGITVPAPVLAQTRVPFIANLDQSWAGIRLDEVFSPVLGREAFFINDADAAGYAEVAYGAARGASGTVIITTLGTGIGSALVRDGRLIPNTELGHVEIAGIEAEKQAAASVREKENLSFAAWAPRLQTYYSHLEKLFWPDLFIVGGGVSSKHEHFLPLLNLRAPIKPALLRNTAGIVGAAFLSAQNAGLKLDPQPFGGEAYSDDIKQIGVTAPD